MRARQREINIFNMSLLDILCGALGAFCFLMLILFPHYDRMRGVADPEVKRLNEELTKVRESIEEAKSQQGVNPPASAKLDAENKDLERELQRIRQDTQNQIAARQNTERSSGAGTVAPLPANADLAYVDLCCLERSFASFMDLALETPSGKEYRNFMLALEGETTVAMSDTVNDRFFLRIKKPGQYKLRGVNGLSRGTLEGLVFTRTTVTKLPPRSFTNAPLWTLTLDADGRVTSQ